MREGTGSKGARAKGHLSAGLTSSSSLTRSCRNKTVYGCYVKVVIVEVAIVELGHDACGTGVYDQRKLVDVAIEITAERPE